MKTMILIFVFAFTLQNQCLAQTFDPTWAGRFQTVLDSIVNAKKIKGASAAVFVPGQGIWTGVSGISTPGVPITPDMRFGIASNTKLFIAVLILKLQEQGILSLEDQLDKWIPSYPNIDSTATIRQVLSHQAGFYDFIEDNPNWNNQVLGNPEHIWTTEETLSKTGKPGFPPGKGWKYSSTGYILIGKVIEAATGKTWVENMHELILTPLELNETFIYPEEEPNGLVAMEWNGESVMANTPIKSEYSMFNAAGAMFSTSKDMVKWYNELFSGNVLSDASMKYLTDFDPVELYSLGLIAFNIAHPYYMHVGISIGYKDIICYNAYTKSIVCLFTNSGTDFSRYYIVDVVTPLLKVLMKEFPKKANDAGIVSIINPGQHVFSETTEPELILANHGTTPLTSVSIHYRLDNGETDSLQWTGSINADTTALVTLPTISISEGLHWLTVYTTHPNGQPEGYYYNDTTKISFIRHSAAIQAFPYIQDFSEVEFPPEGWITNSNALAQWKPTSLYTFDDNYSIVKNNYSDKNSGAIYDLDMPPMNLNNQDDPRLSFYYAYANYFGRNDSLIILVSSDYGANWDTLFAQGGRNLSTGYYTYETFHPRAAHWKNITIPLLEHQSPEVLIRFRDINYNGNNLYLDLVKIEEQPVGIDQLSHNIPMQVYPNPATDQITITGLPLNTEVKITDLHGRVIRVLRTDSETVNLPLNGFQKGIYLLKTTVGMQKLIVQ
jgi:CubicO group peptidase (beta-lactamase class C family)